MRNQGKGSASTKDQCSRSWVPPVWSNLRGHPCHRSNTRRHPKGCLTTTTHSRGANLFSSCLHRGGRRKRKRKSSRVSDSEDEFNIVDQTLSPEALLGDLGSPSLAQPSPHQEAANTSGDMGIQRKQRSTLQEFLES